MTDFACANCGCPSVSVEAPLGPTSLVTCQRCSEPIAIWRDFCELAERVSLGDAVPSKVQSPHESLPRQPVSTSEFPAGQAKARSGPRPKLRSADSWPNRYCAEMRSIEHRRN